MKLAFYLMNKLDYSIRIVFIVRHPKEVKTIEYIGIMRRISADMVQSIKMLVILGTYQEITTCG
jgi:hypothetical protein